MSATPRNADENLLFPPFRCRLASGLQAAHDAGLQAYLFEGWRAPDRQAELYAQGRTSPGPIVTNAVPWMSWHQMGLAADIVFGGPGKWTWSGNWQLLGAIMIAHGLEWYGSPGAKFKETPHFQCTFGLTLAQASALARAHGVPAVWALINAQHAGSSAKAAF